MIEILGALSMLGGAALFYLLVVVVGQLREIRQVLLRTETIAADIRDDVNEVRKHADRESFP